MNIEERKEKAKRYFRELDSTAQTLIYQLLCAHSNLQSAWQEFEGTRDIMKASQHNQIMRMREVVRCSSTLAQVENNVEHTLCEAKNSFRLISHIRKIFEAGDFIMGAELKEN